jgi:molybdenum cofactor cytidylyltransferase
LNSQPNIATLILAAGNSSRMGEPKQLLPWKNSFLLHHTIHTAVPLKNSKTFVVLGANHELIASKINSNDTEILYNENWKLGLGSSIGFGVQSIMRSHQKFDGVLIILSDQPLINSNYLDGLINLFKIRKNQIIASVYETKKFGVPALFDSFYFKELSCLNQDEGAKKVITDYIDNVITVNANHLITDIDTKEDYEKLYKANHQ